MMFSCKLCDITIIIGIVEVGDGVQIIVVKISLLCTYVCKFALHYYYINIIMFVTRSLS